MSIGERVSRLEEAMERVKRDALACEERQSAQHKELEELKTAKSNVVFGAWLANGITCVFMAILMAVGSRLMTAEAATFKDSVKREVVDEVVKVVRAANTNKVH